jgi:hypothetical protein
MNNYTYSNKNRNGIESAYFIESKNNNSLISSQEAVKIIADSNIQRSSKDFVGNTMNIYLKKHKLDLTLLPNKKMIKLSDLTSNYSSNL